jgi:hypothetical protein
MKYNKQELYKEMHLLQTSAFLFDCTSGKDNGISQPCEISGSQSSKHEDRAFWDTVPCSLARADHCHTGFANY